MERDALSSRRRRSSTEYKDLESVTIFRSSKTILKLLIPLRHCQKQQQMDHSLHPARHFHFSTESCLINKMKPAKLHYWVLGWFSMALCGWCTSNKFTQSDYHPHTWKKLYLVHHWPVTVCKMSTNDCEHPPEYWTIHGLWPDKTGECNRTWHFNVTEIKDLLSDMRHSWPDVLHSSLNRTQFWKHEWEKHGTCAATLPVLNSQKKYFGKALELYHHIDLNSCLLKAGIKPSSSYYEMTAIKEALTRFYGVTPKIQCLPPEEGEKAQIIGQIEFCFTKELQLRNCTVQNGESKPMPADLKLGTEELSVCSDTLPTYYPSEVQDHK